MTEDKNKNEKEGNKNKNEKEGNKNKNEKEGNKNKNENNIKDPSKLGTKSGWQCYKDTGNC